MRLKVTVNTEQILGKLKRAASEKLHQHVATTLEPLRCETHPEFRPALEFDSDGRVLVRSACCDSFGAIIRDALIESGAKPVKKSLESGAE